MIRITLLLALVCFLSVYAWRNWFVSLCGSILLLAVVQHPDFPNSIGGIQGANPWNFLLLNVVMAWWKDRGGWRIPAKPFRLLVAFFGVIVVGVLRLMTDPPPEFPIGTIISEDVINSVKWVIPGLLLAHACQTRERVIIALVVVHVLYFLLALQVVRWMPLGSAASGDEMAQRASKIIQNEIGYNRVTLSMMLAGACWAVLGSLTIARSRNQKLALIGAAALIALGQALTGGRTGYVTWGALGLLLCVFRWRKLLPIIPVIAIGVGIALPGVRERMLQGIVTPEGEVSSASGPDEYEMTSGRNIAWPRVIEEIKKNPVFGYGKEAMITTGIKDELWYDFEEGFPHPHQAYLEITLDNGLIGLALVLPIFLYSLRRSYRLLQVRSDPLMCAVGCAGFSLIVALLIGSFGGQTFYPREGAVGMWAVIGIVLRVSNDRRLWRFPHPRVAAPVPPPRSFASVA